VPVRLAVTGCSPRPELEIRRFPPPWSRCGDGDRTDRALRAADACRFYRLGRLARRARHLRQARRDRVVSARLRDGLDRIGRYPMRSFRLSIPMLAALRWPSNIASAVAASRWRRLRPRACAAARVPTLVRVRSRTRSGQDLAEQEQDDHGPAMAGDRRPGRATRQSCSRAGRLRTLALDPRDTPWSVAFSPRFFTAASRLPSMPPSLAAKGIWGLAAQGTDRRCTGRFSSDPLWRHSLTAQS
jgi:hypothetical protein